MPFDTTYFVTLSISVLIAMVISSPLAGFLNLPRGLVLLAIGFAGSELTGGQVIAPDTIRDNFHELIIHLFLPALIFEATLRMNIGKFMENLAAILTISIPLLLAAFLISGTIMHFMMNASQAFPWIAAMVTSALLASTDATALATVERHCRLPERARIIVEGESLLNNALILVLFFMILGIALETRPGAPAEFAYGAISFNLLLVFFGGGALGVLVAIPACMLLSKLRDTNVQTAITLLAVYGAYMLADSKMVEVSGIVAVTVCGIIISSSTRKGDQERHDSGLNKNWSFIADVLESAIYLFAGITITAALFTEHWLAMLIGIVATAASRALIIYGSFPLFNLTRYRNKPIELSEQHVVALGGVRGVLPLALALALPMQLSYGPVVQAIAYGAVIFTLLTHTRALSALAKKLSRASGQQETTPY